MQVEQIEQLLAAEFTDCDIQVGGDGSHVDITIVGELFAGLRAVRKQQMVYAVLNEHIASGEIHAVNMTLLTPAERASQ